MKPFLGGGLGDKSIWVFREAPKLDEPLRRLGECGSFEGKCFYLCQYLNIIEYTVPTPRADRDRVLVA